MQKCTTDTREYNRKTQRTLLSFRSSLVKYTDNNWLSECAIFCETSKPRLLPGIGYGFHWWIQSPSLSNGSSFLPYPPWVISIPCLLLLIVIRTNNLMFIIRTWCFHFAYAYLIPAKADILISCRDRLRCHIHNQWNFCCFHAVHLNLDSHKCHCCLIL